MFTIKLLEASLTFLMKWPATSRKWPLLPWKAGEANIALRGIAAWVVDWFTRAEAALGTRTTQTLGVMRATSSWQ